MAAAGGNRGAFPASQPRAQKREAGSTAVEQTPLNVRTSGVNVSEETRQRARKRLGAKLGKQAHRIERLTVRFEDQNGPRGGVDTVCRIKVVLSGMDSVVFASTAASAEEALDLAVSGIERAVRSALERATGGARRSQRRATGRSAAHAGRRGRTAQAPRGGAAPAGGSLIGRRVGRAQSNLEAALDRPEKRRGDDPVDTAQPGVSASQRRAGGRSTARRNSKRNTARATSALEDSVKDRPSRKSTRKSANRSKRDSNLQQRQVRKINSPGQRAAHSSSRSKLAR